MLLSGSGLNSSNNLPGNTQLSKSSERRQLIITEVPDGFIKTNHALLNNILPVSTNKKVRTCLGSDKISVLIYKIIHGHAILIILNFYYHIFIGKINVIIKGFIPGQQAVFH